MTERTATLREEPTERRSVLFLEPALYRRLVSMARHFGMTPQAFLEHLIGRAEGQS